MNKVICAVAVAAVACGGQEPGEKSIVSESTELVVNWSSTGNKTDPNAALGAQFGSGVATNGNWIAVARQGATATDVPRVEVWLWSGTGWTHNFTWTGTVGHRVIPALSDGWLFIGEPCIATTGCSGKFEGFQLIGSTVRLWVLAGSQTGPWDYGSAIAISATDLAVAEGGGVVAWYKFQTQTFLLPLQGRFTEPSTPYLRSGFGSSIALTNHGVAVAAPSGSRGAIKAVSERSPGYVYVFGPGATDVTRLTGVGTEGAPGPGFGSSLSASADGLTLAVGAGAEVGRSMTAYVFHQNTATNTWGKPGVIAPPSGATGSQIHVAIDGGLLGVTTASGSAGLLRFFSFTGSVAQQNASFALDFPLAPIDLRSGRAIAGQPDFLGGAGYIATYAGVQPVVAP